MICLYIFVDVVV